MLDEWLAVQSRQLGIQKADIERGVMNQYLGVRDKFKQPISNLGKFGLIAKPLTTQTMNGHRAFINVTFRIDIKVQMPATDASIQDFQTADFDDAVPILNRQTGRFSVQHHLANQRGFQSQFSNSLSVFCDDVP